MAMLNVADWVDCTEVEGPGRRFALWVQGCNILCERCCNQDMLPFSPRRICAPNHVSRAIDDAAKVHHIEGVTFLGGEPFLQARGLSIVANHAHELGLSVMVFSGFTLKQIQKQKLPGSVELLSHTDVLVDGPFVQSRPDPIRNWVGSTNQKFHFLTDRYSADIAHHHAYQRGLEVRLRLDGAMHVNGHPSAIDRIRDFTCDNQSP